MPGKVAQVVWNLKSRHYCPLHCLCKDGVLSTKGGGAGFFLKAKGGGDQNFFMYAKGGTNFFLRMQKGGPEKITALPSQTDGPPSC